MNLEQTKPLVIFDLETSGLIIGKDKILELAMVKINVDKSREKFYSLINPGKGYLIPEEATKIHGIDNEKVASAPIFKEIAPKIIDFITDCILAGYNCEYFDIPFLQEEFYQAEFEFDLSNYPIIDIQKIFFMKQPRHLKAAYHFYCNKELSNAHSAMVDTEATAEIFSAQTHLYTNEFGNDLDSWISKLNSKNDFVDFARKIIVKNNIKIFNFGKFKGVSIFEVFEKEYKNKSTAYYKWLMQADFTQDTKKKFSLIMQEVEKKYLNQ